MDDHEFYMKRCFALAKLASKETKMNPMVGAVLRYKNSILSEGYYKTFGGVHAERAAILNFPENKKEILKDCILYISLEPCCIHGKTAPCTDIILKSGITQVVISCLDPNEKIAGKGIQILEQNNINVTQGILEKEGKNLIRKFVANLVQKKTYVILKFAQSRDGFIGKKDKAVWLTDLYSKTLNHKWRSEVDAILIGTNTACIDNPQLTNRLYKGDHPMRIVLDRTERIPKTHRLLSDEWPTWIITQEKEYQVDAKIKSVIVLEDFSLKSILHELYSRNILSVIIEGGSALLKDAIDQDLWDEYRVFISPKALNSGIKAPLLHGKYDSKKQLISDEYLIGYRIEC